MSTSTIADDTDHALWRRVLRPDRADLTPDAARFFLDLSFAPDDLARMHDLAVKNQDGALTAEEEREFLGFRRVGLQLDLLRAKAHATLRYAEGRDLLVAGPGRRTPVIW